MNKTITALILVGLMTPFSLNSLAAEKSTTGSAVPPSALPGINSAHGSESKEDKANKKGEEASGSNSGAEAQATEKDAATSSDSTGKQTKPKQ
ncbi:hypothetical protein [Pseudomonas sp. PD9R]|uniref:hypothetical protein n=1 Tax=Pseudomonas sp. PD9R TaxID=2853534 RepID=UPI001C482C7F|nr:hypothetical protein [Pseudomonas sp. PD9R]MBV6821594.1 hypothetical protein [Pseudomonas sp. PD9R]